MRLYDLLWRVAETISNGVETEGLYEYFLHTSKDHDGYTMTATAWSADPIPDRDVSDEMDNVWVFFSNTYDGGVTSFVVGENGETTTKMIMIYDANCYVDNRLNRVDRGLGCRLRLLPSHQRVQIKLNEPKFEYTGDLVIVNIFAQLSEILTPQSNSFFEFMSKSVMSFDASDGRVRFTPDHSTLYKTYSVIGREIMVVSRVPIMDDPNMGDLGKVLVSFENDELGGVDFFSHAYEATLFNDSLHYHTYVVDLLKKTFKYSVRG